ncbi:MAG: hrpB 1 [Verrucomicrobiaceae bacterium]|nr:hrpB 1 [Verrucomicrobiaceae bacterium]
MCIRLYSQEDFEKRDRFTMPEIQRANLAEVILRMKAYKLGEIETFPFLNPPVSDSIRAGYDLLHELGSLSETHELTPLGRELAKLPLDPTLGRMLLQAREEKALPDMLIIAAGLSIPDPRERPEEKKEMAAAAHKAFAAPNSDFLSLLKIWQAMPEGQGRSNNALRKFCKSSFLSFTRMQEWRDVWKQLCDAFDKDLREVQGAGPNVSQASRPAELSNAAGTIPPKDKSVDQNAARNRADPGRPGGPPHIAGPRPPLNRPAPEQKPESVSSNDDAIHRSILAGQLGHIAMREDKNVYKAGGNRQVMVFPGSNLYERRDKKNPGKPGQDKSKQPLWIVAGEIVQTSQLFARMIARIDPQWIAELGAHLCQYKYSEPHWSSKAQRVLVMQRSIIHGLEVKRQHIDHGKVNPVEATQIFIRGALIENQDSPIGLRFYQHNNKLREKIETMLTRVRSNRVYTIEEMLFRFYDARIKNVSSVHDLNKLVNERIAVQPDFLCAKEDDLTSGDDLSCDLALFPDQVSVGNSVLPITYNYKPGEEQDGVTVKVPMQLAEHLTTGQVQWMVPGMRDEVANVLLRALPRTIRRELMPIDPKATQIAAQFNPGRADFFTALATFITHHYGIQVKAEDWPPNSLPPHLQPRVEVFDQKKNTVASGRDLAAIRASVQKQDLKSDAWDNAVRRVERYALKTWSFGDLPESVVTEVVGGVPVPGYLGLVLRDGEVDVRLFRNAADAASGTPAAVRQLAENALGKDIAWLWKELRTLGAAPAKLATNFQAALSQLTLPTAPAAAAPKGSVEHLQQSAHEHILSHALRLEPLFPLTEKRFNGLCETVRKELPALTHRVKTLSAQVHDLKQKILALPKPYPGLVQDVQRLVPLDLLSRTPHSQLQHLPRYLKAIQVRAERASINPVKDADKAQQIEDFNGWEAYVPRAQHEAFRWMLEEYRVQVFAQELGTAQPVSIKRLEAMMVIRQG